MNRSVLVWIFLLCFAITGCGSDKAPDKTLSDKLPAQTKAADTNRFIVAGSGTNLPITEKLAEAYKKKSGISVEISKSIGSDGAVKAVRDGTLQLGLLSRPLTEAEQAAGLKALPYALVGVVWAVHPAVPENNVTDEDILLIHQGEKTVWADGKPILVLIRGMHDSSNQVLFSVIPDFAKEIESSIAQKRWLVMYHDIDMANALRTKAGSFGHTNTTEIKVRGGIKALSFNGVEPTMENMVSGKYPWVKKLSFVYQGELSQTAQDFIAYVTSPDGGNIIRDNGGAAIK